MILGLQLVAQCWRVYSRVQARDEVGGGVGNTRRSGVNKIIGNPRAWRWDDDDDDDEDDDDEDDDNDNDNDNDDDGCRAHACSYACMFILYGLLDVAWIGGRMDARMTHQSKKKCYETKHKHMYTELK